MGAGGGGAAGRAGPPIADGNEGAGVKVLPAGQRGSSELVKMLAGRWFVLRNLHRAPHLSLLQSRGALCWLRGPMTRGDLRELVAMRL